MSFTNGQPWIATEKDCLRRWSAGKPGENFRCGLCGHKFAPGDRVRWQYTNDISGAGGNPMVCEKRDGPDVIERWKAKSAEWASAAWWWFRSN